MKYKSREIKHVDQKPRGFSNTFGKKRKTSTQKTKPKNPNKTT